MKAYPPFINFFEDKRTTIIECDAKSPKFHAFLKKCESRPECQRQTLVELLICPVQRLPRYPLLLKDILKHTEQSNPDNKQINLALKKVAEILTHIDEEKGKTQGQVAMFELINDIEGGEQLLSSNRHFICKTDVKIMLKDSAEGVTPYKGHTFTLFLFNDVLEVSF